LTGFVCTEDAIRVAQDAISDVEQGQSPADVWEWVSKRMKELECDHE